MRVRESEGVRGWITLTVCVSERVCECERMRVRVSVRAYDSERVRVRMRI